MMQRAPDWPSVARGLEVMAAAGVAWRADAEATERHLRPQLGDSGFTVASDRGHALTGEALLQRATAASTQEPSWPTGTLDSASCEPA